MAKQSLPLEARRIRTIIVTLPIITACSFVLYKRLVLGEDQRKLPSALDAENQNMRILETQKKDGTPKII
ncbi:hypothetical protein JR316_0013023 [Psilocybe cubensis]|uniref:Uncharacterized protein n=2 Tax=Psilocybe cubensis TaxID=181762 RepID=A0ACB8GFY8_PSICU|nr:hypothetical protein JR316_0013023 [Psilocybe cubensis]KAH9474561.1 hypothetical protein JR316_0013023 [Psilocybe cubensis]